MADPGPSAQSPNSLAQAALAEALRARLDVAELRSELGVLKTAAPTIPRRDPTKLHLFQIQAVRDALVIAVFLGILWLGHEISLVTVPMLLAMLLAYLFEPLV